MTCGISRRRVDLNMVWRVVCELVYLHVVWWLDELIGCVVCRLTIGLSSG